MNYGVEDRAVVESAKKQLLLSKDITYVTSTPSILLEGLRVRFPENVKADKVRQFHVDGMQNHLWSAWRDFEYAITGRTPLADNSTSISAVEGRLKEAFKSVRSTAFNLERNKLKNVSSRIVKASSIIGIAGATFGINLAIGGTAALGAIGNPLASFLAGVALTNYLSKNTKLEKKAIDELIDFCLSKKHPRYAAHLWWLDKWSSGHADGE